MTKYLPYNGTEKRWEDKINIAGSEPLKKAIRAAISSPDTQKISNISAGKAQGNQHEIRIVFFERD